MSEYHGYLLASIMSVWVVIGGYVLRTWLRERKSLGRQTTGGLTTEENRG